MISPNELLFSVDENNHPIAPQPRKLSHETGIWHRSCHVWIVNDAQQILCQQRSLLKDTNPGLWEPFFGGHLSPNQEYIDAALTEVQEEVGLQIQPEKLQFFKEYRFVLGTEFQGIFIFRWNGDSAALQLEHEEVEQVAWRPIEEIREQIVEKNSNQWTSIGYEKELLVFIQK